MSLSCEQVAGTHVEALSLRTAQDDGRLAGDDAEHLVRDGMSGLWSAAMTEIAIRPLGRREFLVEVSERGRQTTHQVTAPERLGGGLELPGDALSEVVRRSFEFLLEREPASSILSQFSLEDISRFFPDYERELALRLG